MEQAVALSPRDAGYRILLADAYLKSGRFDSARATYADVVELDPSNVRASLSVALIQIAQGRPGRRGRHSRQHRRPRAGRRRRPGLCAGRPVRAGRAAARIGGALADGDAAHPPESRARLRLRRRLAPRPRDRRAGHLARRHRRAHGAMGRARPPRRRRRPRSPACSAPRPARMPASPRASLWRRPATRRSRARRRGRRRSPRAGAVARPVRAGSSAGADPRSPPPTRGPPKRRLSGSPPETYQEEAIAEGVAPEPVRAAPSPRRSRVARAASRVPDAEPFAVEARYDMPAISSQDGPAPQAPVLPAFEAPARPVAVSRPVAAARARPRRAAPLISAPPPPRRCPGRSSSASARSAPAMRRSSSRSARSGPRPMPSAPGWRCRSATALSGRRPLTTTFNHNGRTLHRVSVSGFASNADAQRLCGQIRGTGGVCFVRGAAGDASIRWAARYTNPRQRNV